ncbi:MAG TPA: CHAT domain-containing tetratricopeptide repeat protein [Thermoanaerobaculia bacterium]|jgi:CHAT domain-containing protein/Tfp pilus assembly protein PilF|nr:CHAT domain-containing tetratricopeptide repeat protein [Thermoanaerobaculia bacterium]
MQRARRVAWLLLAAWTALGRSVQAGILLAPGTTVEGLLPAGEESREIDLDAGGPSGTRRLITLGKHGTDLLLELTDATRQGLLKVHGSDSRYGLELLLLPPVPQGTVYHLVVRAAGRPLQAVRFTLSLETLNESETAARQRIAAAALTTEAAERSAEETPGGRQAALALYQQALPTWRSLGRVPEQIANLVNTAVLYRLAGDARKAVEVLGPALELQRSLGKDPAAEAVLLIEMGFDRWTLGEVEPARDLYRQALARFAGTDDAYGKAAALNDLGLSDHARGDLRAARGNYEEALPLFERTDLRAAAVVVNNIGGIYQVLGEPSAAIDFYRRALDLQRKAGNRLEEARDLGNLASVAAEIGLYQQALSQYEQALEIFRGLGDLAGQARMLSGRGLVYRALGDPSRAGEDFQASLSLRRKTADRRGEAITLHNLALAVEDRGDLTTSASLFEQALAIQRSLEDRRAEAITLQTLAQVDQSLGQTDQALDLIARSVAALRALDARRPLCVALRQQSEILTARAVSEPAIEPGAAAAREALGFCRATQDQPGEAQALLALAKAERALGHLPEAEGHAEEALGAVESMRAGIASPDLRASFLSRLQDAYGLAIDLLMQRHRLEPAAGFDRQALAMAERARARGLLDLLREAGTDVRQGIDPALLERRARLEERLTAKSRHHLDLLDRPPGDPERAATEKELQEILAGLETVDGEIRTRSPRYAALTQPHPLDAAGIQKLLDPTTLLLVYRLGEPKSYLWAVSPSAVTSFELPPKREIEDAARAVYGRWKVRDLAARWEDEAAAARLSAMILGPAAGLLREQRLAVVADGALEYLPFAALPLSSISGRTGPLVVHHEIVSLPSASVLALLRQEAAGRPAPPDRIAVVADPVFRADDPRLPATTRDPTQDAAFDRLVWSRTEAEAIARIAAPRPALVDLGFDANLDAVTGGKLRGYRIVHLATHGVLDSERPALSGLVLSLVDRQGKPRPGLLGLGDIYNLSLDADLVVLSGCQTALGKQVRGEGLVGLTRGFLYAGADRVMSSLWRVQDRATAELMTRFYRALLTNHLPPSAALRSAQLSMLRDRRWSLPYDWAGFVVYGDWGDWQ